MADTKQFLDYTGLAEFKNSLNGVDIVTTAGTGAAYTATVPGITALKAGLTITIIPHTVSTAVLPTLNLNSLGAKAIRRRLTNSTVSTVASAAANWLGANKPIRVTYDGTYWIADMDRPNAADIYGTLGIANGGTGATTAAQALENLGLNKMKAGFIYPLAGETIPKGFLLCDGAAYSRTQYPELFAAIGTLYGEGDGSTTFNVPNLQTRVPVGAGGEFVLGATGGETEHTLTVDEMPSHKHATAGYAAGESVGYPVLNAENGHGDPNYQTFGSGTYETTYSEIVGGSQPHNNMQPYTVVNYIIATGENAGVSVADIVLGVQAIPLGVEYGGTGATTAKGARANLGAVAMNTVAVTLAAASWSNLAQTVNVSGVTANNTVIVTPAPASYDAYCEAGVYCSAQASGSLTFKCTSAPTAALTVNVLILN